VVHETLTAFREKQGLSPFDDGLPGERENVFRIIKHHLFPPDGGATRGAARSKQQTTPKGFEA
jgi:hypothetical protein